MITVENLAIRAGDFALENVSFSIPSGAWCVFMGKTGMGKTTILEAICGLRKLVSGTVQVGERDVTDAHPSARGIGYVPQDKALFMTMTVAENLAFALMLRRCSRDEMEARVNELAELLQIKSLLQRYPDKLSGGEAQRVALGRALAARPRVLCLDEPLSALDDETREEMHAVLRSIRERGDLTTLHVTHHISDAQKLADKLLVLRNGQVIESSLENLGNRAAG